jgi:hypothetical protein
VLRILLTFQRGGRPMTDGLMIEITLRMNRLARVVEITKVVGRVGGVPQMGLNNAGTPAS